MIDNKIVIQATLERRLTEVKPRKTHSFREDVVGCRLKRALHLHSDGRFLSRAQRCGMDNQVVSVVVKSSALEQQPHDDKAFTQPGTWNA
ncbi:hypothetical protein D3C71_1770020 [compost metagenome]